MKRSTPSFLRPYYSLFLLLIAFGASLPSAAQENKQSLRLFLIGNSFSGNATKYLPELSKQGGHTLVIGRAELGGCPLQRHWDSVAVNLLDSTRGKAYNGKSLKQLLSAGTWDVVTIQQYSLLSGDVATYHPYAWKLYDFIKSLQPQARVLFHQTWAYRTDAKKWGRIKGLTTAANRKEMWTMSRAAYHTMADSLGIGLIPSGDAFEKAATGKKFAYQPDKTFNYDQPAYPALPNQENSLHVGYYWNKEQKLAFDPNHANDAGCYLAGLVWYGQLFGEDPTKVSFQPATVPAPLAAHLKKVAAATLAKKDKAARDNKRRNNKSAAVR